MRKILWQVVSRHALVTCTKEKKGCFVTKQIAPKAVNKENANWVNKVSKKFRDGLKELNVPLAEPYTFYKKGGNALQKSPYIGIDLEQIVKKRGTPQIGLIDILLESIKDLLLLKNNLIGIDARLSNFCLGSDGKVYYVDTFPPLIFYRKEYIVHFPNPTDPKTIEQEVQRKFNYLGILRRLRFSILEQDAGLTEENFLDSIYRVLGQKICDESKKFFDSFLDKRKIEEAIDLINLDDPDSIREVALRIMPKKGTGQTIFFQEIFNLSSNFCPLNISSDEKLERIKELFLLHFKEEVLS